MTLPTNNIIIGSRKATARMADRNTSFVFNEWYVGAFIRDISRALPLRTLLGNRVRMYRTKQMKSSPGMIAARIAPSPYRKAPSTAIPSSAITMAFAKTTRAI